MSFDLEGYEKAQKERIEEMRKRFEERILRPMIEEAMQKGIIPQSEYSIEWKDS